MVCLEPRKKGCKDRPESGVLSLNQEKKDARISRIGYVVFEPGKKGCKDKPRSGVLSLNQGKKDARINQDRVCCL